VNFQSTKMLVEKEMAGVPLVAHLDQVCHSYLAAKQRSSFPQVESR
jgi:hypothetical protein